MLLKIYYLCNMTLENINKKQISKFIQLKIKEEMIIQSMVCPCSHGNWLSLKGYNFVKIVFLIKMFEMHLLSFKLIS